MTLFHSTAFASHASAARFYDVPLPTIPDEHVSVLEPTHRRRPRGIVCHLQPAAEVRLRHGVRVSTPAQLFVELASILSLVDLVVAGDFLVKNKHLTCKALAAHCAASTSPGAVAARRAASYVRDRVDSPMESRLRMLIVLAGLPEPKVNITITDVLGQPVRRYDLSWPEIKVIVEYDGRHHIEREEQWEADLQRREDIDSEEWRLLVVVSSGIYKHPGRTIDRIWRLLRDRRLPGTPRQPSSAWRPHFPGHQ
jgi:very-short-patch-repair endonuclease